LVREGVNERPNRRKAPVNRPGFRGGRLV